MDGGLALTIPTATRLLAGDCRDRLRELHDASIDAVVTDPPYGLGFMGRAWDAPDGAAFAKEFWSEVLRVLKPGGHVAAFGGTRTYHRLACAVEDAGFEIRDCLFWIYGSGFPKSHNLDGGLGTALKPACEPILLVRKPFRGTVEANVQAHGTGALNIDRCRVEGGSITHKGRWPANVLHDGSDEVLAAFPDRTVNKPGPGASGGTVNTYGGGWRKKPIIFHDKVGSAARFFYCAKASQRERAGSKHPTVKPVALMRWLCRLITPPGWTVLDPFAGSGTTGEAAWLEGLSSILIEREPEFQADIVQRLARTGQAALALT